MKNSKKSAATAKRNYRHGFSIRGGRKRLYTCWAGIIQRCTNPNEKGFKYWGGRGIRVCEEWKNFINFKDWAISFGYAENLTIERKDVNGNYEPSNCTWIPKNQQNRNRTDSRMITAFGETKGLRDWFEDPRCKIKVWHSLLSRLFFMKWDAERAISTPKSHRWNTRPK